MAELPPTFRELHLALGVVDLSMNTIYHAAETHPPDNRTCAAITACLCNEGARLAELTTLLEEHMPDSRAVRTTGFWNSMHALSKNKTLRDLAAEMMELVQQLVAECALAVPLEQDIAAVATPDLETGVHRRIKRALEVIKVSSPRSEVLTEICRAQQVRPVFRLGTEREALICQSQTRIPLPAK